MRKYCLFILVIAISLSLSAKQPPAQSAPPKPAQSLPADAASREQLIELFDVLEVTQQMNSIMETMEKSMRQSQPALASLSDQQKADLDKLNKDMYVKVLNSDLLSNLIEQMIPVYQRHFTHADVDAIINFYSSAAGQKLLHEQPSILQELMPKVMAQAQEKMQSVLKDINYNQRLQQIMEEGRTQTSANPK